MIDDEDDDLGYKPSGTGAVAMLLPFATALAALLLGMIIGVVIGWLIKPTETKIKKEQVVRDLTAAELAEVCKPQVQEKANELDKAQKKVSSLQQEVDSRKERVAELENELKRVKPAPSKGGGGPRRNLAAELEQAKRDLAKAREELVVANEEKERLVVELTQTKVELADTKQELQEEKVARVEAQEDALVNKWERFLNDAQLEVCEKGNRKKLGRCRETVVGSLRTGGRQRAFTHCVRSGQATPTVRELEKKASLPSHSEMINEEAKQTKGWYVLMCDPSLPEMESDFLKEQHLPR